MADKPSGSNPYEAPLVESTAANSGSNDRILVDSPVAETAELVSAFFTDKGYRLEQGTIEDAYYGIGNKWLRILFGAFVRRFRFHVRVTGAGNQSLVQVDKGMIGISGGAIGYARLKKELVKVRAQLAFHLTAS